MPDVSSAVAVISIIFSGFLGTGGAGYAFVQWWTKRNDLESKANAAKILTDAASGIILELREEKKELNARIEKQTEKIDDVYREFRSLKYSVLGLVSKLNIMLPNLTPENAESIKTSLEEVQEKLK